MIPGMNKITRNLEIDDSAFGRVESIIFSMTPEERENPDILNLSRKQRIARGCGRDVHEIHDFIKQFEQMSSMMHQFSKGGMMGGGGMNPQMMGGGGARPSLSKRKKPKRRF